MRLLIAGDFPYDLDSIKGGICNVTYNIIKGLENKNIKVTVLSVTTKNEKTIDIAANIKIIFKKIPNLPQTLNTFLFEFYKVKNEIIKIKPDIIHTHNMTGYTIASIRSRFPCLITPHGDWIYEQLKNGEKTSIKTISKVLIWKIIYIYIFKRGKNFSAVSPYIENLIRSYNKKANIFCIKNPLSDDYIKSININNNRNSIMWAGRICKLKRLDLAIKIFRILNNIDPSLVFEVAGEPDYHTKKEFAKIKDEAIKYLGNRIIFHGHLCKNEMIKCYDRSKIFLLTSEQEASPMVVAEAMARGAVPVTFDLPGIKHLIINNYNGFSVNILDITKMVSAILLLLNNNKLFQAMSKNAMNSNELMQTDVVIDHLCRAYEKIFNER